MSKLKYRILLVDADVDAKNELQQLFIKEQLDYKNTSSIKKAFTLLHRQHFDVVIVDFSLYKSENIDFLEEVRALYPNLPLIIISSHTSIDYPLTKINPEITYYLKKPVDLQIIIEIIQKIIRVSKNRFLEKKYLAYEMKNTFYSIISSDESSILKLLNTINNLIQLIYPEQFPHLSQLKMAIYEGLSNAVEHGNKRDINKKIYFFMKLKTDKVIVNIKDEGDGFNYKEVKNRIDDIKVNHGLQLIDYLMDATSFNSVGNEIYLLKILN